MNTENQACRIQSKKQICIDAVRLLAMVAIIAGLFLLVSHFRIHAAFDDLDATFGGGGITISPFTEYSDEPTSILIQPDGKIVVSGYSYVFDPSEGYSYPVSGFVARYNSSGTLDTTFAGGGFVVAADQYSSILGIKTALQPDGKIVTIGSTIITSGPQQDYHFAVWRYNANGSLDTSFGTGGKASTSVAIPYSEAVGLVLQPDSKIVVIGRNRMTTGKFAIVRYNADGSLDNSFGTGGKVISTIDDASGENSWLDTILLQPDGKFLLEGTFYVESTGFYPTFVRYNPDGSLDLSFGLNGKVIHSRPICGGAQESVLQVDGKIVLACGDEIARFNVDGSVDTTFAVNGVYKTDAAVNSILALALQPDGKIVGIGSGRLTPPGTLARWGFAATRLNPDGSPDTSFGPNGRRLTTIGTVGKGGLGQAVALQADGKILGAGVTYHSYASNASGDAGIVRYAASESVHVSGRVMTPDGRGLRNATVSITDSHGVRRAATTNSFGLYTFDNVPAGDAYVIGVSSKRYRFERQLVLVNDNQTNVDFVGLD